MKKMIVVSTLATVTALIATPVLANADLAKKSNCLACHAVDKKVVGPAYQDIAKKYKAADEKKLVENVMKGTQPGKGVWGTVPMPPKGGNAALTEANAATLVKWILAGAK